MSFVSQSKYEAPKRLLNGHIETIFPAVYRKVNMSCLPKEIRIDTSDGDFLDLDYYDKHSGKTVIISHGLEGNSKRPYILGMAKAFFDHGWNVLAWNYRGCSGAMNQTMKFYHSGFIEDLVEVVDFIDREEIGQIALVGFSLGGNLTLKYLGTPQQVNAKIIGALAISVPMDLLQGSNQLSKISNSLYAQRFLISLKRKIREKARKFPKLDTRLLDSIRSLRSFDDHYTAPLHGFVDALDYYHSCSALFVLHNIRVPTLIINAQNDPFLSDSCYPYEQSAGHEYISLETPARGGHVGFASFVHGGMYWTEYRGLDFIESTIKNLE